jgi:hypothetical protein
MPKPYNPLQVHPSKEPLPQSVIDAILIGSAASGDLIGTYPAPTVATSVKAIWILDANPVAAGLADFVGPNALIDAYAAYTASISKPMLYLRSGIYNWNAATQLNNISIKGYNDFTGVTIVSPGSFNVGFACQIENITLQAAGNFVILAINLFSNVSLKTPGNVNIAGFFGLGLNKFDRLILDILGDINVNCSENTFEFIYATTQSTSMTITREGNRLSWVRDCQFSIQTNAYRTIIDQVIINNAKYLGVPLIQLAGSSSDCSISNVVINNMDGMTTRAVELYGIRNSITNISLGHGGSLAAGYQCIDMQGFHCTLHGVVISDIYGNIGATDPVVVLGDQDMSVRDIAFTNINVGDLSLIKFASTSSGTATNLRAGGVICGHVIEMEAGIEPLSISNVYGVLDPATPSSDSALHITSTLGGLVSFEDCVFSARGDGLSTLSATMFISDVYNMTFKNVTATATRGRALAAPNSGVVFESLKLFGGSDDAGAGRQLFYGYGNASSGMPLVMRDVHMEYGSSNCDPTSVVPAPGTPVILFGGRDNVSVLNHGHFVIDGLTINPGASVGASGQHRDSILVLNEQNGYSYFSSTYDRIHIDLREKKWAMTGGGRAFISGEGSAAVLQVFSNNVAFELAGTAPLQASVMTDVRLINMVEGDFGNDSRFAVSLQSIDVYGLMVDGPSSGVHGTGAFSAFSLVELSNSNVYNLMICRYWSIRRSGGSYLRVSGGSVTGGSVRNVEATSSFSYYVQLFSSQPIVSNLSIEHDGGTPTTALVEIGSSAGAALLDNCLIDSDVAYALPYLRLEGIRSRVNRNRFTGIGTQYSIHCVNARHCQITDNTINGQFDTAIRLDGLIASPNKCEYNVVKGNIATWTVTGIYNLVWFTSGAVRNTVSGNIGDNQAASNAGNACRIQLTSGAHQNIVDTNTIKCITPLGVNTAEIDILATSDNNIITGNMVVNDGAGGVGEINNAGAGNIVDNNKLV